MSVIIRNGEKIISISDDAVTASTSTGLGCIVKLSRNKDYVLKFNKTCLSTCNVDMLICLLENDVCAFDDVYRYITLHALFDGVACDISRAAFYAAFNDNIPAFVEFFRAASHEARQQIIRDHMCDDHDAKMSGIISLSTYVGHNQFCAARCAHCDNAICKYCFAESLTNCRIDLKNKLIRIHAVLTAVELSAADIPYIDALAFPYARFEAFGDINNVIQANNYNLIAACNPLINFTLWTKNPGIIQATINAGMALSNNLVIGLSSLYLNTPELDKARRYPFIRFLFTVYDDDYIAAHDVIINCGAKCCMTCGICYKYLHNFRDGLMIINERKK